MLKISLAGANNLVPTTSLTPCIIIIHVYTCNYSGARKNIDAREWRHSANSTPLPRCVLNGLEPEVEEVGGRREE